MNISDVGRWQRGRQLALASAVVAVAAAFMPWLSVYVISVTGFDGGDGKITALCGLIGAGLAVAWWTRPKAHAVVQLVLGAVVALIGLNDLTNYAAIGLYLTLASGMVWVAGSVMLLRAGQQAADVTPDAPAAG